MNGPGICEIAQRMLDCIGLAKTLIVLEALGGTRYEKPQGYRWRHRTNKLAELIGWDAAEAFHAEFAADFSRGVDLPKPDRILQQMRCREIHASDASSRVLALRYRLTERRIRQIRAEAPPEAINDRQLDLFADCAEGGA